MLYYPEVISTSPRTVSLREEIIIKRQCRLTRKRQPQSVGKSSTPLQWMYQIGDHCLCKPLMHEARIYPSGGKLWTYNDPADWPGQGQRDPQGVRAI